MSKHAAPTTVQYWPDGFYRQPIAAEIDDWDGRGGFSIPREHPMAAALWRHVGRGNCPMTVLDSDELEWNVEWITVGQNEFHGRYVVRCVPWQERLRNLLQLQAFVEKLKAEGQIA